MPQEIGKIFSSARRRRGLSIEDVSYETKIRKNVIKMIESSDFSKLGSITYAKSFITIYAKFLGINVNKFLPFLKEHSNPDKQNIPINLDLNEGKPYKDHEKEINTTKNNNYTPLLMWIVLSIFFVGLGLAFYFYTSPNKIIKNKQTKNTINKQINNTKLKKKSISLEEKNKTTNYNFSEEDILEGPFQNVFDPEEYKTDFYNKNNKQTKNIDTSNVITTLDDKIKSVNQNQTITNNPNINHSNKIKITNKQSPNTNTKHKQNTNKPSRHIIKQAKNNKNMESINQTQNKNKNPQKITIFKAKPFIKKAVKYNETTEN